MLVQVDRIVLERALGRRAALVWAILLDRRDREGVTFVAVETIAEAAGCSAKAVLRALERLELAGLVKDIGWGGHAGRSVYRRRVLGRYLGRHAADVPSATRTWLKDRARPTPRLRAVARAIRQHAAGEPRATALGLPVPDLVATIGTCPNPRTHVLALREPGPIRIENIVWKERGAVSVVPTKCHTSGRRGPHEVPSKDLRSDDSLVRAAPSEQPACGGHSLSSLARSETEAGSKLGGSSDPRPIGAFAGAGIPSYPTVDVVPAVQFPEQPRLDLTELHTTKGDCRCAQCLMIAAYEAAVRRRWPDRKIGQVKLTPASAVMLGRAAQRLSHYGIPPHHWAAFAVDRHIEVKGDGCKPPAIMVVYPVAKIEKMHAWCSSLAATYGGGRIMLAPTHRALIRLWEQIQEHLAMQPPQSVEELRCVLQQYSVEKWDAWVEAARRERAVILNDLHARMRKGEWIW